MPPPLPPDDAGTFVTGGGATITRRRIPLAGPDPLGDIFRQIDRRPGIILTSDYESPGRYTRWSFGLVNPPLVLEGRGRSFSLTALNRRGEVLLPCLGGLLAGLGATESCRQDSRRITGTIRRPDRFFPEEERSRQHSVFSIIRGLTTFFATDRDSDFGLYGALGHDLVFQFEDIPLRKPRDHSLPDLVLYLCDELVIVDGHQKHAFRLCYDISLPDGSSTAGLPRDGTDTVSCAGADMPAGSEWPPGRYAAEVERLRPRFARGDFFEIVLSCNHCYRTDMSPSGLSARLQAANPSPYGFLVNLGRDGHLIGSSPEMFVRSEGRRIETSPISGTTRRGRNAIEDSLNIQELLNSAKDESELTMCTDVDRNDKARICIPGSVRIIGRRQIELYSHLIHTVDHVEGMLLPEFDALDAFLSHCWAVTVTGAPKRAAIAFLEETETSCRRWYGGAVGKIGFNGNINTGLILRTIHLKGEMAAIRTGATLLHDSDPDSEERECALKAAAMVQAVLGEGGDSAAPQPAPGVIPGRKRCLLVDCEDSFIHTLAGYLRRHGAMVRTLRHHRAREEALAGDWDLVLLSPGPGRPAEFGLPGLARELVEAGQAVFGVCLGFQALVEAFGGTLGQLPFPVHGKATDIRVTGGNSLLFAGIDSPFAAGRYHSLFGKEIPDCFRVTARTADGIAMAIEHREAPVAAVLFHPESLMTLPGNAGPAIMENVLRHLCGRGRTARPQQGPGEGQGPGGRRTGAPRRDVPPA